MYSLEQEKFILPNLQNLQASFIGRHMLEACVIMYATMAVLMYASTTSVRRLCWYLTTESTIMCVHAHQLAVQRHKLATK